jgi:hypothetical protein
MSRVTLYPGDITLVNGVTLEADRTVTLRYSAPIERRPAAGLLDLPSIPLRIDQLWKRNGRREPMTSRQNLRRLCGSAYVRRSASHQSCQHCRRVWTKGEVPDARDDHLG